MKALRFFPLLAIALFSCNGGNNKISQNDIDKVVIDIKTNLQENNATTEQINFRVERGVAQVAALWEKTDGSKDDFAAFCKDYFIADDQKLENYFNKLEKNLEILKGFYNKISVDLKLPLHLNTGELDEIDEVFGAFEPSSHFNDDMFANKIAFITLLNFPTYTLEEKNTLGANWTRKEWAYARVGDIFTSRVPAELSQEYSEVLTAADQYISDYNICMGSLRNDKGEKLFPDDLKLISHWGLRDELKSQYAQNGIEQQKMIYQVMTRIISQEIPQIVINNPEILWNPYTNKVSSDANTWQDADCEPATRYQMMLDNCNVLKKIDKFQPAYPTYIDANFDATTEISKEDVEKIFTDLLSSSQVKAVAEVIKQRLGRDLQPFDIWYNGFAERANSDETQLDKIISKKYTNVDAFEKDLPNLLKNLGFSPEKAKYICEKVKVDASRGAGHAWGSEMKGDKARLRTRIDTDGMKFKGYNIAVHEFGHNVEQTLSLYNMDYYSLHGVPNTAFTEALAFVFQKRDMQLLGYKNSDKESEKLQTLDIFWNAYEIIGVSLVDIKVWEWLYSYPNANKTELKLKTEEIAKEIWNQYYAPIFGIKDQTILGIYSHMIDYPLYLSNYPMGHLIEFQLEDYLKGRNFATEVERIFTLGRLTPKYWMLQAVGTELSVEPLLKAVEKSL